jgi:hypothetical protein
VNTYASASIGILAVAHSFDNHHIIDVGVAAREESAKIDAAISSPDCVAN